MFSPEITWNFCLLAVVRTGACSRKNHVFTSYCQLSQHGSFHQMLHKFWTVYAPTHLTFTRVAFLFLLYEPTKISIPFSEKCIGKSIKAFFLEQEMPPSYRNKHGLHKRELSLVLASITLMETGKNHNCIQYYYSVALQYSRSASSHCILRRFYCYIHQAWGDAIWKQVG